MSNPNKRTKTKVVLKRLTGDGIRSGSTFAYLAKHFKMQWKVIFFPVKADSSAVDW